MHEKSALLEILFESFELLSHLIYIFFDMLHLTISKTNTFLLKKTLSFNKRKLVGLF